MSEKQPDEATKLAEGREAEPAEDIKEEAREQAEAQDEPTHEAPEPSQREKDLEMILSAYLPEGADLETEMGRITRAGKYEPILPEPAKEARSAPRSAPRKPRVTASEDEAPKQPSWEENAKRLGLIPKDLNKQQGWAYDRYKQERDEAARKYS